MLNFQRLDKLTFGINPATAPRRPTFPCCRNKSQGRHCSDIDHWTTHVSREAGYPFALFKRWGHNSGRHRAMRTVTNALPVCTEEWGMSYIAASATHYHAIALASAAASRNTSGGTSFSVTWNSNIGVSVPRPQRLASQ
jgi:hypothetical protein